MSRHVNRSSHASSDYHDSNLAVAATVSQHAVRHKGHNNCSPTQGFSCLAPRLATCSSSHRGCFPKPGVSHPRSPRVHRCGPASPCVPERSTRLPQHRRSRTGRPALMRRLTNNSAAGCFFRQCLRISLLIRSSFIPLATNLVVATRCEARLGCFRQPFVWLNTPIRSRWRSH